MALQGTIVYDLKEGTDNPGGNYSSRELKKDDTVYSFTGTTYGVISGEGIAVTDNSDGKEPFYQIPRNAVSWQQ